ncbi:putative tail protein [Shewanella phage SFCi1]|nr:putative tail protein [Shewanella phage SFCi1]
MAISTAVPLGAIARVVGIKTQFVNTNVGGLINLPQRVALIGQGASASTYPTTKQQITSAVEAGTLYGFGSPIHLAALQLLPANGDGVGSIPVTVYPLEDDGSGVAAAGEIATVGTATKAGAFNITINGVPSGQFVVEVGDTLTEVDPKIISAVNGVLETPMIASAGTLVVDMTAKWAGVSSNELEIVIEGPADTGMTFGISQPTGGLVNPDIQDALDQVGDVWETMFLNCLDIADTTALDALETFGEGRWGALTRKPMVAFTGHSLTNPTAILAITDLRKTDRVNSLLSNPGSVNLPFVSAAGELARIVTVANNKPANDYGRQVAKYIAPGPDSDQWNYAQRDQLVKGGASTIEVRDGEVTVSDTVTMYRPDGDPNPAYRFVKDIVKLQNIIFNLDLIFNTASWDGAPLIPDDQPTINRDAKKPKNAVSAMSVLAENLGLAALISDVPYTLANTVAEIDSQNPNRLNAIFPVKLSGNANIISVDLNFGFYFGTSAVIN